MSVVYNSSDVQMDGTQKESSNVYSSDSGRCRSASGSSAVSSISNYSRCLPSHLNQLLNHLPQDVRKTSWEIRNELGKCLNPCKDPIGNDWRLVASRLGFSADNIDVFSRNSNPTMEMLKLCDTKTTKELFEIIEDIERVDVIEDLITYLGVTIEVKPGLPTEESLESQPFEESCSDISKLSLSKQPSEQEEEKETQDDEFSKFLCCQDSKDFWMNIRGSSYEEKKWPDFLAKMNKACPEESTHGGIDRFLCHIFKINYDERQDGVVRLIFFFRLLAFFGPFKPGGCLTKMYDLIINSVSKCEDGKKHSWFAGYMNKEETEKRLNNEKPGKFIVRFSGSKVEEGWFVLAVQTLEGVVQIEIEKDKERNELLLAGEAFSDLLAIVEKLRNEIILKKCQQLLINPCPDLPLNSNFMGYAKGIRNKVGRGRGRPR